jgi:hypothetical protein
MAAGFLDEAGQVGYFRLDSSMRYREAFEMWHLTGMDRGDWLDRVVEDVTGKKRRAGRPRSWPRSPR